MEQTKLDELEQRRKEDAISLFLANKWLRQAKANLEHAEITVFEAQRQVNHYQSEVDECDKGIRRQMAAERNEVAL